MVKKTFKTFYTPILVTLLISVGMLSCGEEEILPTEDIETDVPAAVTNATNSYVNSWILDNMEYWYFWNSDLPSKTDKNLAPAAYFKSLLHADDRFSWIQSDYEELLNSLQGISREAGYEFVLYREKEGSSNVILQILYVKSGSPAESAGLKRGDVVTHVNGIQLTTQNYEEVLSQIESNHELLFKSLLVEEQAFDDPKTVSLSAIQFSENPNYLHKVIETGGRKIGYFVYNFFAAGTDRQPGLYDEEMDAIFANFKSKGITDLVVDLRFNSGGSESSARNLASLIGRGVDASKIFLKRQYNDRVEEAIIKDPTLGEEYLVSHYVNKANNVGGQLSSGRVYILTSSRTASASELIINALRPFMEVFLIGDTTYGKNVGSISLFEEKDAKNSWGMQPIVVKVFNSEDQSDYSTGFAPDVIHKDNGLYLYPLGDPREALLAQAIGQITGTATNARVTRETRTQVGHSLDLKRRSYNLIMDQNAPFLIQ